MYFIKCAVHINPHPVNHDGYMRVTGCEECLQLPIKAGALTCFHHDFLSDSGYTPVHLAAQSSNVDMLRLLVHGRADVDVADGKSGRTALHHAVELDDLPVAGFLLMEVSLKFNGSENTNKKHSGANVILLCSAHPVSGTGCQTYAEQTLVQTNNPEI